MNKKAGKKILGWFLTFLPALIGTGLYFLAARSKTFADWYADKIYPLWVGSMGRLTGLVPFSVNEMAIYLLILLGIIWVVRDLVRAFRKRVRKGWMGRWLRTVILAGGCRWLAFMIGCGVNYNGRTFAEKYNLDISGGTKEELADIVRRMVQEVNALADQVPRDESGLCIMEETLLEDAEASMRKLSETYDGLDGFYPPAKAVLWSEFLSMENICGVHSPFTSEAQYNRLITPYNIPHTICHELSHLKGFMREDEANYIGFLACIGSDSAAFRYSGYMLGYIYVSNALYSVDYDLWFEVRQGLCDAALYDLEQNTVYWGRYQTKLAEVKNTANDNYLKFNHQSDGVKSYGRVVNLILAYYRENPQK